MPDPDLERRPDTQPAFITARATAQSSAKLELTVLHRHLLSTASRLVEAGELQAGVVLAQTAVEVQTEAAITGLLREHGIDDPLHRALTAYIPKYTLQPSNDRFRKLWEAVTGDKSLTKQAFWPRRLQDHIERRNGVAHGGLLISRDEADESITVVSELMEYIENVLAQALGDRRAG